MARPKGLAQSKAAVQPKTTAQPKTGSQLKGSPQGRTQPSATLNGRVGSQSSKAASGEEQKKQASSAGGGGADAAEGNQAPSEEDKQDWTKAEHTCWARQMQQPALADFLDSWAAGVNNQQPEEELIAEGVSVSYIGPFPLPDESTDPANVPWVAWDDPWAESSSDEEEKEKEEKDKKETGKEKEEEKEKEKERKKEKDKEPNGTKKETKEKGEKSERDGDGKKKKWDKSKRGGAVVYSPPSARTDVCVLWIHGGSFQWQTPYEESYFSGCSRFAIGTGLTVVMPDHLLSGEGRPFHAQTIVWQLITDYLWLAKNDPVTYQQRESAVIIAGDSSGGTQAVSILFMLARHIPEAIAGIPALVLISPSLDLTCRCHTYTSNAYAEDHRTGDAYFTDGVEVNRTIHREICKSYTGSEEALVDTIFSPYWLARWPDEELLAVLERFRVPIWMCIGAPEALCGEVLDFATRLRGRLPMEVWLHEGVFHCWVLARSCHPFPNRDMAMHNMADFIYRIVGEPGSWPEKPELKEGIHYYVDEWY